MRRSTGRQGFPAPTIISFLLALLIPCGQSQAACPLVGEQQAAQQEIEDVGLAIVAWIIDQVSLAPGAGSNGAADGGGIDVSTIPLSSAAALETLLVPNYIAAVPELDPWGNPYEYRLDEDLLINPLLSIRTAGSNGTFEGTIYVPGEVAGAAEDLVIVNGFKIRFPPVPLAEAQPATDFEIRVIGAAILAWVTDQIGVSGPPVAAADGPVDLSLYVTISHADLETLLVPMYLFYLPENDPWGNPYDFWLDDGNLFNPMLTAIRSRGADGAASGTTYPPGSFPAEQQEEDLVWVDGFTFHFPSGLLPFFLDGFEHGDAACWSVQVP